MVCSPALHWRRLGAPSPTGGRCREPRECTIQDSRRRRALLLPGVLLTSVLLLLMFRVTQSRTEPPVPASTTEPLSVHPVEHTSRPPPAATEPKPSPDPEPAACGLLLTVASDHCASGRLHLRQGFVEQPDTRDASWQVGAPRYFPDLACGRWVVRAEAEGCTTLIDQVDVAAVNHPHTLTLLEPVEHWVHVVDEYGAPIVGAHLFIAQTVDPEPSDADGWIGPVDLRGRAVSFVQADGYLPVEVPYASYEDPGDVEVVMLEPRPVRVSCRDGDGPCSPDTRVFLPAQANWVVRHRRCTWEEEGTWRCPSTEGDRVGASLGERRSPRVPAEEGVVLELPPADGELCLDWSGGPASCTLHFLPVQHESWVRDRGQQTLVVGEPVAVALVPGEALQATLACQDGSWDGELVVQEPGSGACRSVALQPLAEACGPADRDCTLAPAQHHLRLHHRGRGCSGLLPAGPWRWTCGEQRGVVDLAAGEVVEWEVE